MNSSNHLSASSTKDRVAIHCVISGDGTKGWLHTHGMNRLGLPELEIRDVQLFLAEPAGALLRHVCDYMHNSGTRVYDGETMATSDKTIFRFVNSVPIPGQENHFEVERLRIVEVDVPCSECGALEGTEDTSLDDDLDCEALLQRLQEAIRDLDGTCHVDPEQEGRESAESKEAEN